MIAKLEWTQSDAQQNFPSTIATGEVKETIDLMTKRKKSIQTSTQLVGSHS